MEFIEYLIKNPIILTATLLITFFIKYKEKVYAFFPDPLINLLKLDKAKKVTEPSEKQLSKFLKHQEEFYLFQSITGLQKNSRNEKILWHYNQLGGKMRWFEFKKIHTLIKNPEKFAPINNRWHSFKCVASIIGSISAISLFIAVLWSANISNIINEVESRYTVNILSFLLIMVSTLFALNNFFKIARIRDYNKIVAQISYK